MVTWLWLRHLDAQLRTLVPFATALIAVLIDVAPVVGAGPAGLTSFSTLCVVYFWSLYRPDLFTPTAAFLTGLVYDGLAGLPLGLTSLALLLVRNLMILQQRFFVTRSFLVIWSCFLLLAPAVEAARWLLSSLWWGHLFALQPMLFELLVTMALYPAASWLLSRILNQIPRLLRAS
jgi:rod shape-determining protein MreD